MKKTFFDLISVGKIFLWLIVLPQILVLLGEVVLILVAPLFNQTPEALLGLTGVQIAFTMLAQVAFLIIVLVLNKKYDLKKSMKLSKNLGLRNAIICVALGLIAVLSLYPIVSWFDVLLESLGYNISTVGFEITSPFMLILGIVLLAFVPAVLEELVFRGAIFQGLKRYGKWVAIFGTSALFVLLHGSLQQVVFPFLVSIILCLTVFKTENVLASITVHFVANTTSLVVGYAKFGAILGTLPLWASILLAVGGMGLMIFLTTLLKSTAKPKTAEEVLEMMPEQAMSLRSDNGRLLRMAIGLAVIFYIASIWVGFTPPSV